MTPRKRHPLGSCERVNSAATASSTPLLGPPAALPDIVDRFTSNAADRPSAPGAFNRLLYTIQEAQRLLSLSRSTIYRCISANNLDARKVGGRTLITGESVARFAATLPKLGDGGAWTERGEKESP